MRKAQSAVILILVLLVALIGIYFVYESSLGKSVGSISILGCGDGVVVQPEECEPGTRGIMLPNALCLDTQCGQNNTLQACKCLLTGPPAPGPLQLPERIPMPRVFPACGNGRPDSGEECGDPGTAGCQDDERCVNCLCLPESIFAPAGPPLPGNLCGNNVIDINEECGEPTLPECPDGTYCHLVYCRCFIRPPRTGPVITPVYPTPSPTPAPAPGTPAPIQPPVIVGPINPCGDGYPDYDAGEECDDNDYMVGKKCYKNLQEGVCKNCTCVIGLIGMGWILTGTCIIGQTCPFDIGDCADYPETGCEVGTLCISPLAMNTANIYMCVE